MKYAVYKLHMDHYDVVGEVEANTDAAAVEAAHAKWDGGLRLKREDRLLNEWPLLEWPRDNGMLTDKQVAEIMDYSEKQKQRLDAMPAEMRQKK